MWVVSDTQIFWTISLALKNEHNWIKILKIAFDVNAFINIYIWLGSTYIYIHTYTYIHMHIYIYIYICLHRNSLISHFTTIFAKNSIQPDSWVVENSSYKICQLKFCKFQVVMFSEKSTFATAIVNIFCESSLINHKW